MLIYNYKKEFLGIDEADLDALGLSTLADLRAESADFADLFVRTPGCIHNFKHVHWIDYVLDKNGAEAKVIIDVKNKNYSATLSINTAYLVDSPAKKAFSVVLNNLRLLTSSQTDKLLTDINSKPVPTPASGSTELFTTPESAIEVEDLTADDAPHDGEEVQEVIEAAKEGKFANYVYNPEVASEELGLPIDLIEEFIQDFITQTESFKDELYQSIKDEELDNIKIQSHKLKGVAANLRIEDALETLIKINTSNTYEEIKMNLDKLYLIINKLSGKTPKKAHIEEVTPKLVEEEDELILSFKEDKLEDAVEILDEDVPDSISIIELADDNFLAGDLLDDNLNEDLSILDDIDNEVKQEEALDIRLEYDKELIANDIGIDLESFDELFNDYIKESKELAQTITQSADNNDLIICKNLAIKLKGMSENMRVHRLDSDLDDIINTTDTDKIKVLAQNLLLNLTDIST